MYSIKFATYKITLDNQVKVMENKMIKHIKDIWVVDMHETENHLEWYQKFSPNYFL